MPALKIFSAPAPGALCLRAAMLPSCHVPPGRRQGHENAACPRAYLQDSESQPAAYIRRCTVSLRVNSLTCSLTSAGRSGEVARSQNGPSASGRLMLTTPRFCPLGHDHVVSALLSFLL